MKPNLETFTNVAEPGGPGRIIVRCVDGASLIIPPGESGTVWLWGKRFYRERPTWWHRLLVSVGWR